MKKKRPLKSTIKLFRLTLNLQKPTKTEPSFIKKLIKMIKP